MTVLPVEAARLANLVPTAVCWDLSPDEPEAVPELLHARERAQVVALLLELGALAGIPREFGFTPEATRAWRLLTAAFGQDKISS